MSVSSGFSFLFLVETGLIQCAELVEPTEISPSFFSSMKVGEEVISFF